MGQAVLHADGVPVAMLEPSASKTHKAHARSVEVLQDGLRPEPVGSLEQPYAYAYLKGAIGRLPTQPASRVGKLLPRCWRPGGQQPAHQDPGGIAERLPAQRCSFASERLCGSQMMDKGAHHLAHHRASEWGHQNR